MNPAFPILCAMITFSPMAEAASWHTLQTTALITLQADEPQAVATDNNASDMEKKGRKLKIWDKIAYSRPLQAKPGDFYYTSAKSLTEINCTTHTLKLLQRIYFDSDGNEFKSVRYGANEKSEGMIPDTPGETLINFACNFKPATAKINATPRPVPPPQKEVSQPSTQPKAIKEKVKEPNKSTADDAKSTAKPTPTEPKTKPVATKKAAG